MMTLGVSGRFSWPSTTTLRPQKKSPAHNVSRQYRITKPHKKSRDAQKNNNAAAANKTPERKPNSKKRRDLRARNIALVCKQRGHGRGEVIVNLNSR